MGTTRLGLGFHRLSRLHSRLTDCAMHKRPTLPTVDPSSHEQQTPNKPSTPTPPTREEEGRTGAGEEVGTGETCAINVDERGMI